MTNPSDNIRQDIFADSDTQPDAVSDARYDEPLDAEPGTRDADTPDPTVADANADPDPAGEPSNSGSSFTDPSSSAGGADAVPDTPDGVQEDNIDDAAREDYARSGRDVINDQESDTTKRASSDVSPD